MEMDYTNGLINTIWLSGGNICTTYQVWHTESAKLIIQKHWRHGVFIQNINHASQIQDQFTFINCSEKKLVILPNEMALFKKFCKLPPKQAYFLGEAVGGGNIFHTWESARAGKSRTS